MGMGSASGSESVGREPMFTATDSASVGIRVSPAAEVPFCPTRRSFRGYCQIKVLGDVSW